MKGKGEEEKKEEGRKDIRESSHIDCHNAL